MTQNQNQKSVEIRKVSGEPNFYVIPGSFQMVSKDQEITKPSELYAERIPCNYEAICETCGQVLAKSINLSYAERYANKHMGYKKYAGHTAYIKKYEQKYTIRQIKEMTSGTQENALRNRRLSEELKSRIFDKVYECETFINVFKVKTDELMSNGDIRMFVQIVDRSMITASLFNIQQADKALSGMCENPGNTKEDRVKYALYCLIRESIERVDISKFNLNWDAIPIDVRQEDTMHPEEMIA